MEFKQIKETCLYVQDLREAKSFYSGKLGFPIINEVAGSHVFFRVGTSVLLCFNPDISKTKTEPPPHFAFGNQHIAFEVDEKEYDSWKKKIEKLKIPIIQEQVWKKGLKSFYFRDPDNHVLEIVPLGIWD